MPLRATRRIRPARCTCERHPRAHHRLRTFGSEFPDERYRLSDGPTPPPAHATAAGDPGASGRVGRVPGRCRGRVHDQPKLSHLVTAGAPAGQGRVSATPWPSRARAPAPAAPGCPWVVPPARSRPYPSPHAAIPVTAHARLHTPRLVVRRAPDRAGCQRRDNSRDPGRRLWVPW